jgi:anti-sigma regulatory factor (Ser/Thr protein kinase)
MTLLLRCARRVAEGHSEPVRSGERRDPESSSLTIRGDLREVARIRRWLPGAIGERLSPRDVSELSLAVTEICTNIVRHGYQGEVAGDIEVHISTEDDAVHVTILDRAPPFVPDRIQAPSPEALAEGGYGLVLARGMVDEIRFQPAPGGGNRTTLVKRGRITVPPPS